MHELEIYRQAYADAIEKVAYEIESEVTPERSRKALNAYMDGYREFGPGSLSTREYFEDDVREYVKNHPLFEKYLEDEAYNDERSKIKHPHSGKIMAGVMGAGALAGGLLKKGPIGKRIGKGIITGALSAIPGGIAKLRADEVHRIKNVGPMRDNEEYLDEVEAGANKKLLDLVKSKMSLAEYNNSQMERDRLAIERRRLALEEMGQLMHATDVASRI